MKKFILTILMVCSISNVEIIASSRAESASSTQQANFNTLQDSLVNFGAIQWSGHECLEEGHFEMIHTPRARFFKEIADELQAQNETAESLTDRNRITECINKFDSLSKVNGMGNLLWNAYEKYLQYRIRDPKALELLQGIPKIDAALESELAQVDKDPTPAFIKYGTGKNDHADIKAYHINKYKNSLRNQAGVKKAMILQQVEKLIAAQPDICDAFFSKQALQLRECFMLLELGNLSISIPKIPKAEMEMLKRLQALQEKGSTDNSAGGSGNVENDDFKGKASADNSTSAQSSLSSSSTQPSAKPVYIGGFQEVTEVKPELVEYSV